jgi:hypothetical protein
MGPRTKKASTVTVKLALPPEIEAHAVAQAAARGVSVETYLQGVLTQLLQPSPATALTESEFEAGLDALAEGSDHLPVLSDEAVSRDGIYHDHD